ncbi:MAG TPA: class I SAM-dependent methyltransferase [Kofleriaceae bacterium]|nr:class I SAM-dependent methyltransferase [Kofleriaceae bacterium]
MQHSHAAALVPHDYPISARPELLGPAEALSGYDRWSRGYDGDGSPVMEASAWVLDRSTLVCGDCDVVELGCGTARHAARVLGEGARSYTGVDGSIGMLHLAGSRPHDPRASFVHADLMQPWAPQRTFDLALVVLVLEHLPSLEPLCETLARVVRPGGRVRIIDLHPERIASGVQAYFHDGATEVRFASRAHPVPALSMGLEAAGFDVVRRDWLASDAMVTAVPRLLGLRGVRVLIDMKAVRRR